MIFALPGMGADHRMYVGPWLRLANCRFLDWPTESTDVSIDALARHIVEKEHICDGAIIIGSSLGGIVACEIAKIRKIEHLFLIGSAQKAEEISGFLRAIHPLVDLAPMAFIQRASGKMPNELCQMFRDTDAQFVRNMCRAIFTWDGLPDKLTQVHRLHGRHDLVIPPPQGVGDLLSGGHLLAMSHAEECVQFIESQLSSQTCPSERPI
ncbi:MAG: alpha/beta hydrolase [Candidatus Didemnitutus sp.]|nr:alpha/beta hydrolase [Candidatus Didemnitutus sp.]